MRLSPNYHGLLAFIGSARATNSHRAQMLKALSITPFEGSRWCLRRPRAAMEKVT